MDEKIEKPLEREVIFKFIGGRLDGLEMSSRERQEANSLWIMTLFGTIGREFQIIDRPNLREVAKQLLTDSAPVCYRYRVSNRADSSSQIMVTSDFVVAR